MMIEDNLYFWRLKQNDYHQYEYIFYILPTHRLLKYIDTKAKCRHPKN
jgi:hypothetical protein